MTPKNTSDKVKLAVMATNIEHIKNELVGIKKVLKELGDDYVTKVEFEPVKKIVYGMVALILIGVVGALIALVI